MKILYVNDNDLIGSRFNGHELQRHYNSSGHDAKELVLHKQGKDANTEELINSLYKNYVLRSLIQIESKYSMQNLLFPFGRDVIDHDSFKNADVVHYHLIHNNVLSVLSLPTMFNAKQSVWTLHDPWALTGHCIHPFDCMKWMDQCLDCPYLDTPKKMNRDAANQMWKIKQSVYNKIDPDIVVASEFMKGIVTNSSLMGHVKNVHLIPFGINLSEFHDMGKEISRKQLNICRDDFVIAFRSDISPFKGLNFIKKTLRAMDKSNVCILTVGMKGLLKEFADKFRLIELGWANDNAVMVSFYSAADIFLMPSTAEAFGLMAVEAMATSRPVIVCDGTALPSITNAPKCGISVRYDDVEAMKSAIEQLKNNPDECIKRGCLARELAQERYDIQGYFKKMLDVYQSTIERNEKRE